MQAEPIGIQIDLSCKVGVELIRRGFHLQAESKIFFYVRIFQTTDGLRRSIFVQAAEAVEKHDLCRRLPLDLRHQPRPLCHAVPMEVDTDFDGGIFFQYFPNGRLHPFIGSRSLPFAVHHIILPSVMDDPDAVFLLQNPLQFFPYAPDALGKPLGHIAVGKTFVDMGMENQYFRFLLRFFYGQVKAQCLFHIDIARKQTGTAVYDIIFAPEILQILHVCQFLRRHPQGAAARRNG